MIDRVIWDSWHKFVYYDYDDKNKIIDNISNYLAKIDSNDPIVVYICNEGLPVINKDVSVDKYKIDFFHHRYYELLITVSIINKLINDIDRDILNSRFGRLFRLCSDKVKIFDVIQLRDMLNKCIDIYRREYDNYINTGILGDFYNDLEIPSLVIDLIIPCIKRSIGLLKYFTLLIDGDNKLSIFNQMSINDYIGSRCTGYLSVNILLSKDEWEYYYTSNRQFIQDVHDYSEIDLRREYVRKKSIQN